MSDQRSSIEMIKNNDYTFINHLQVSKEVKFIRDVFLIR